MKPGKTSKNFEGRSVYERMTAVFFDSNPVEDLNETVHQEFMGYGTAAHEFMNEKKVLMEMARTQSDQMRNSNIEVNRKIIFERALADSTSYLIVEEFDFHDADNGHHYSMRLTTILEETDGRWLVSHMHGSTPDSNIAEEEALPMEGLRRKNRELEKKIKEGIREAELEAALERIRSSSLAMQKPDDLGDVVSVLFEQMQELSVDMSFASVSIFIFEEGAREFTQWLPLPDGVTSLYVPYIDHPISSDLFDARESGTDYFEKVYSVEEKNSWVKKGFEATDYKKLPEEFKTSLLEAPGYAMSISLAKHSGICIPSFEGKLPSSENVAILKRVGKVFEQAYTRFLDLQKAEAQTREAKIEAALEKVRSRTMAMHKSEELKDVVKEIFDQLACLSINAEHAGIVVDYEPEKDWHFWIAETQDIPAKVTVPYLDLVWDRQFTKAKKEGQTFFTTQLNFEEKNSFYKILLPHIEGLNKEASDFYFSCPGLAISTTIEEDIGLYIENFSGTPYSEEENKILKRFGKVFQQAYTRFLDLQKAEAQAREAQIVASLERVRAATMAMHNSAELSSVLSSLFEQFDILGIHPSHAVLTLINKEKNTLNFRTTGVNGYKVFAEQEVDLTVVDAWLDTAEKWKKSTPNSVNVNEYPPEVLPDVWEVYRDIISAIPKNARPEIKDFPEGLFITEGYCKFGYIGFAHHRKPTDEEKDIVRRIAVEFGTLYQRFLDLQKAEAQAREAEIQLALERVRARAMAMQKSDELSDVIALISEQMDTLQIPVDDGVALITFDEDSKDLNEWMANEGFETATNFYLPYFDHPVLSNLWEAKDQGQKELIQRYTAEENRSFLNHIFQYTDFSHTPEPVKEYCLAAETYATSIAFRNNTAIFINDYSGVSLSDSEMAILHRFAKEFDQTYTRFLDLQKAEAQAREAEVNLAVERVRAKALAMFKSEEILQVVIKLRNEILGLNIPSVTAATIHLKEPGGMYRAWDLTSINNEEGQELEISLDITYRMEDTHPDFFMREVWAKTDDYFVVIQGGDRYEYTAQWLRYNGYSAEAQEFEDFVESSKIERAYHPTVPLNNGRMCIDMLEPPDPEVKSILKKMAGAFDLAYKRFEDLQKAEAQTREAQIEGSLEKVRAQTMGMQASEDLSRVASVMFDQMKRLGGELFAFGIVLCDKNKDTVEQWHNLGNEGMISPFSVPVDLDYIHRYRYDQWKAGEELFSIEIPENYITEHFELMFELPSVKAAMDEVAGQGIEVKIPDWEIDYGASFKHGYLLVSSRKPFEEDHIFPRFAKVFDQAYTRYLDLQKAEGQAREAEIQLALERVRARTMAMQHSDELREAVLVIYEQLQQLHFEATACNIIIMDKESGSMQYWVSGFTQEIYPLSYHVPFLDHPYFTAQLEPWKEGVKYAVMEYSGEAKRRFDEIFFTQTDFKNVPEQAKQAMTSLEMVKLSTAYCRYGAVQVFSPEPLSEKNGEILQRFASVFEQTYTRFLDLQKAEAQTREALIETGLERARAQSMMMQHSGELDKTCKVFHEQLHLLGIDSEFSYLWLPDEGKMEHLFWATWHSESMNDGSNGIKSKRVTYQLDKSEPSIAACYVAWESGQPVHVTEVKPVDLETYFKEWEDLFEGEDKFQPKFYPQGLYYVDSYMKHGCFGIVTRNFLPDDEQRVLHLFAREFERTYTRFLDLKKAESQAREAKIEAALEKVRSRTMGMQSSAELPEVANMLFLEVQALGIPAWSSGFNILAEDNKSADAWMSSEGTSLKPFTLRLWGEASFEEMGAFVRSNDTLMVQEIGGEALTEHYNHMKSFPDLKSIFEDIEAEGLSLPTYQINHLCKFNHGFLLFITYEPVPEAHDIFKRFTRVFNQTYTRFLDLQTAEKQASLIRQERDRLEIALKELHATQDQLVQQEKLASLGQLTAGIAHEIKNPLNFVNNFSDLSLELVEEVRDEIRDMRRETTGERSNVKGETEESPLEGSAEAERRRGVSDEATDDTIDSDLILDILDDIEANLKTIYKHGSRADSIDKSMLQHSRGGDGKMEPTPLNPLIKEYVNLAFHGMRAGNEPINVDIDLQLEDSIGEIPLVSEDFSRVILNLVNNAFDAMRSKLTEDGGPGTGESSPLEGSAEAERRRGVFSVNDYKPVLVVRTNQTANTVTIEIEDNGPGIPDEIKNKIMQPFFTTKKGTQGTGLGLSITNDIVKAHGGRLEIDSDNQRTIFSIKIESI